MQGIYDDCVSQNNSDDDVSLFDPEMLHQLDWSCKTASFKNGCCPTNPGDSLEMRPLRLSDYHRGTSYHVTNTSQIMCLLYG